MEWKGRRASANVEDRRGMSKGIVGGGIGTIILVILYALLGGNPADIINQTQVNFYCSADQKLYIDLSFYDEMAKKLGASGDFAMAYVIAHEVGHHVQNQQGTLDQVHALRSRLSEAEYNEYSVRLELQADYYAGVWAHYANRMQLLEEGDLEEALNAASAVGDDRIQKKSQGYVVPDSFTHGTSEQRQRWFYKGYQSGTISGGDTFSARTL